MTQALHDASAIGPVAFPYLPAPQSVQLHLPAADLLACHARCAMCMFQCQRRPSSLRYKCSRIEHSRVWVQDWIVLSPSTAPHVPPLSLPLCICTYICVLIGGMDKSSVAACTRLVGNHVCRNLISGLAVHTYSDGGPHPYIFKRVWWRSTNAPCPYIFILVESTRIL